ncbi:MAG TPA: hypothetical protein VNA04_00535 [Thermoanaerobaculia bacterium]|nr:hypothetical protein [Thermoanaerobaculia bacterium]
MIRQMLMLGLAVSAASAIAEPKKEPWLWTAEERIRERFSPESKAARLQQVTAAGTASSVDPNAWPIDGDTHAELYFPWELMDHLLRMQAVLAPPTIDRVRETYRKHIESAGWDYDTFWVGHEAFDRFLYAAMTPGLLSWTTDRRGAALLIRAEKGCK